MGCTRTFSLTSPSHTADKEFQAKMAKGSLLIDLLLTSVETRLQRGRLQFAVFAKRQRYNACRNEPGSGQYIYFNTLVKRKSARSSKIRSVSTRCAFRQALAVENPSGLGSPPELSQPHARMI